MLLVTKTLEDEWQAELESFNLVVVVALFSLLFRSPACFFSRKAMLKRWESLGKACYNYVKHIVWHIVVHMKHADTSIHNQIDMNCASAYLV